MNDRRHAYLHILFGSVSLALSIWSFDKAGILPEHSEHYASTFTVCIVVGGIFALLGFVNLYVAFAFIFGRVDEVLGTLESAVFLRDGLNIREHMSIRYQWVVHNDDGSSNARNPIVLFVSGWRPWVCDVGEFRCERTHLDSST